MSTGLKANSDGSAAIQVGGTDVITLTSGGAATFVTSPTTVQAGTAAAPSITFSGDTNTGIYSPGADQVAIATGGSQRAVVDASGRVVIGYTAAQSTGQAYPIQVKAVGGGAGGYGILNSSNVISGGISLGSSSDNSLVITADPDNLASSSYIGMNVDGTERARFNSTGAFVFAGGTTTADGIGITFPATQSASTNANTLDDYEEGTWTPVIQGGSSAGVSSYTDQQGRYTKIGRQVTVWFFVEVTAATGTGGFQIGGLPFASNGTINQTTGALMTDRLNWTAGSSPVSYLGTGISYLQIYISADDAVWSQQQMVNEAFAVLGAHTYFV